jgi:hypothetical protein
MYLLLLSAACLAMVTVTDMQDGSQVEEDEQSWGTWGRPKESRA